MKHRRDEKIEQLERRILKARRVSREELSEIVAAPQLLEKINARIRSAQPDESAEASRSAAGARAKLPLWGWRKIGFAFGGLAVLLAASLALIFLPRAPLSSSQLTAAVAAPEIDSPARAGIDERGMTENPAETSRNESKKIAFKTKFPKSVRRGANKKSSRKTIQPESVEPEAAFYPLAFADSLEEAREAGQVIRVELSRSSLLALGVSPPDADENLKVKTDLLIGADGVARGIRFVK